MKPSTHYITYNGKFSKKLTGKKNLKDNQMYYIDKIIYDTLK